MRLYPGGLSVSRAFGDYNVKFFRGKQMGHLSSEPDVYVYDLAQENFDFIFLGCDGIYDIFQSKELSDKIWEYCWHFHSL